MDKIFSIKPKQPFNIKDDSPAVYIIDIGAKKFEVCLGFAMNNDDFDPEKVFDPEYKPTIEEFSYDTVVFLKDTLKDVGTLKEPDQDFTDRLIRLVSKFYQNETPAMKVIVE